MKVMIWHTPRGIIDEGGKVLEGYINFNITLMSPPENDHMNVSAALTPSHCDLMTLHAGNWCGRAALYSSRSNLLVLWQHIISSSLHRCSSLGHELRV